MLRTMILCMVATSLALACAETNESPDVIPQDINVQSLPWVEDQSELMVSLYDTEGDLVTSKEEMLSDAEYEVVFKTKRPVALYVNKSFGFQLLSDTGNGLTIGNVHSYRIMKTEPGFKQVIFEVYPLYYQDDELIHERPQIFVFPGN